jgi:hypothetical protein
VLALPALALAAATDPKKQINPVDQRKAASIVLKRTDFVAGWKKVPNEPVKQGIEKQGGKAAIVKQGQIAFPKLAPRTAAYRVVINVSHTQAGQTTTVPFTLHVIAIGNGRGDASLVTFGLGNGIPGADLRAFAKLLAGRLATAKL